MMSRRRKVCVIPIPTNIQFVHNATLACVAFPWRTWIFIILLCIFITTTRFVNSWKHPSLHHHPKQGQNLELFTVQWQHGGEHHFHISRQNYPPTIIFRGEGNWLNWVKKKPPQRISTKASKGKQHPFRFLISRNTKKQRPSMFYTPKLQFLTTCPVTRVVVIESDSPLMVDCYCC